MSLPPPFTGLAPDDVEWVPVTRGLSGATVLHDAGGARYAKLVPAVDTADLAAERDRIAWLADTGIPGPTVLDWRVGGQGACLVTSAVPGVAASELGPARLLAAWPSIAATVRHLHSIPPASCPYGRTLTSMMSLARRIVAEGRVRTEFLPEDLQHTAPTEILIGLEREVSQRQEQEAADMVVCHGDLCLPNILIDPDTLQVTGLIDLGRLGRADPYADLALLLGNARGSWPDAATAEHADGELAERYGTTLDAGRRDFYLRLDPLTW